MPRQRKPVKFRKETAGPKLMVTGLVREVAGWRVVIAEVPADIVKQYEVKTYEPDLKQIAEARVIKALWGED